MYTPAFCCSFPSCNVCAKVTYTQGVSYSEAKYEGNSYITLLKIMSKWTSPLSVFTTKDPALQRGAFSVNSWKENNQIYNYLLKTRTIIL